MNAHILELPNSKLYLFKNWLIELKLNRIFIDILSDFHKNFLNITIWTNNDNLSIDLEKSLSDRK